MKNCRGCDKPTNGSVGAAGIEWPDVCQPCKDDADKAALKQLEQMNSVYSDMFKRLFNEADK